MQEVKKLPGDPTFKIYFTKDQALAIPIFFITNEMEKMFFTEVIRRYKYQKSRLLYRVLYIKEPFQRIDQYGQGILAEKTLGAIAHIAWYESLRFRSVVMIEIGTWRRYFYNGIELEELPRTYNEYTFSRQTDKNIDAFCRHFGIDSKAFQYDSSKLFGQFNEHVTVSVHFAN